MSYHLTMYYITESVLLLCHCFKKFPNQAIALGVCTPKYVCIKIEKMYKNSNYC